MTCKPLILITRPAGEAQAFSQEMENLGLRVLCAPMLAIEPLDYKQSGRVYDGLIFTSAQAVRLFDSASFRRDIPVFAVGPGTAGLLEEKGFRQVVAGPGGAESLGSIIHNHTGKGMTLLYVRGADSAYGLETDLRMQGFDVDSLIVYRAVKAERFTDDVGAALRAGLVDGVTLLSVRTAEAFCRIAEREGFVSCLDATKILCLSPKVLECVRHLPWGGVYVPDRPDRQAMIDLIRNLFVTGKDNEHKKERS